MPTCLILDSKLQAIKEFLVRFTTLWPFTPKYPLVTLAVQAEIPFTTLWLYKSYTVSDAWYIRWIHNSCFSYNFWSTYAHQRCFARRLFGRPLSNSVFFAMFYLLHLCTHSIGEINVAVLKFSAACYLSKLVVLICQHEAVLLAVICIP